MNGDGPEASLVRNPYDGHEHSWYWPTSLPCPRHCYRCGIQHPDDTTPPLVAASPVPPVVPDKPALAPEKCPVCFGTGVQHCGMSGANCRAGDDGPGGNCGQPCDCRNASVPAVTDDEAAKYLEEKYGKWPYEPVPVVDFPSQGDNAMDPPWYVAGMGIWHDDDGLPLWKAQSYARAAVAALRSAGFLIVHHTKET